VVTNHSDEEEVPPAQPPRRLPPPTAARSILSMGFGNKTSVETPNPGPRPAPTYTKPAGPAVQELTAKNFDSVTAGKFALVDFYAPYCKYCVELDPIWKQLGEDFAFASDKLIIAKVDVDAYKTFMSRYDIQGYPTIMFFDGTNPTPEKYPWMRELEPLTDFLEERTGIKVADGAHLAKSNGVPPPINLSSKPSIHQVRAIQSRPAPATLPASGCLLCRDFSGPDGVAAQYPRQSLPRNHDQIGYLADVLCGPFSSATDKARAIFSWLHENIAYDTVAFFGKNVKHREPTETISSGLAVCAGYAGLFAAIALKAGLEAVVVGGHGKGYGYTAMKPCDRVPPRDPSGHAWNAVRIDGGEWKLCDPCWGAGNVNNEVYNKHFSPSEFTMSNEDFGLKHFPEDDQNFFRADGSIPTWEQYMVGPMREEPLQLFGSVEDHGLSGKSFTPPQKRIPTNSNEVIRFQFSKICEHWDHEKNGKGKPYCMIIKIWGVDGRKEDFVAMESNEFWWWADIKARDLGAPGQTVSVYAVTSVNGKDVRGMTRREYLAKKGKCGMGFAGIAAWELV
jgi:protein disulfide-isomerase-like protein